jgi:hypothetical protein
MDTFVQYLCFWQGIAQIEYICTDTDIQDEWWDTIIFPAAHEKDQVSGNLGI